jgi:hypothetical protein
VQDDCGDGEIVEPVAVQVKSMTVILHHDVTVMGCGVADGLPRSCTVVPYFYGYYPRSGVPPQQDVMRSTLTMDRGWVVPGFMVIVAGTDRQLCNGWPQDAVSGQRNCPVGPGK